MKRVALAGALLVLVASLTVPTSGLGAGATVHASNGKFLVTYVKGKTADEKALIQLIKESQLSQVAASLSKSFKLPTNITIAVTRTQAGPYFDPATKTIDYNLPFAALMYRVITSEYPKITPYNLGVAFASLQYFVLFHEIGHSLINVWHIPVLGREEDAVDAFSTIFMTRFVQDGDIALWGADFFNAISGNTKKYGEVDFADEHSLSPQRVYSIVCWVYGSNEKKYSYLAKVLPAERRARCSGEYQQLETAWLSFLKPHVRTS